MASRLQQRSRLRVALADNHLVALAGSRLGERKGEGEGEGEVSSRHPIQDCLRNA